MSVNRVILIGNLGADPELKHLPSGQVVCEMRIATNERWMDKNNQKCERVEWHRIVIWGKQGENATKYLKKGRAVYIEGRIQTRDWIDKTSGEKKYMTEIIANTVQFLGTGQGNDHKDEFPAHDDSLNNSNSNEQPSSDNSDVPF